MKKLPLFLFLAFFGGVCFSDDIINNSISYDDLWNLMNETERDSFYIGLINGYFVASELLYASGELIKESEVETLLKRAFFLLREFLRDSLGGGPPFEDLMGSVDSFYVYPENQDKPHNEAILNVFFEIYRKKTGHAFSANDVKSYLEGYLNGYSK